MKLKLTLTLLCLFGIGMFARSQSSKKQSPKVENTGTAAPVFRYGSRKPLRKPMPPRLDENGNPLPPPKLIRYTKPEKQFSKDDCTPLPPPPPPPPPIDRSNKPLLPPKVETQKFAPGELPPPPPPPSKPRKKAAPITPDTPPLEPEQG